MKHYFFNNPVFRLIAPAVYGTMVYLLILLLNNNVPQINDLFVTQELYVCIVLTYLCFETIRGGIIILGKAGRNLSGSLRITVHLLLTTVLSVGVVAGVLVAYFQFVLGFSISATQLTMFSLIFSVTALLYNVMYFGHYYLHQENTVRLQAEHQQRTVLDAEMLEYRNDINPDLLFESLENLIATMYKDVEKAEDYIDCLGAAYRYVLTNRSNELVPLAEDLKACRDTLKLLNAGVAGQLVLDSRIHERDMQVMLIPGSLPVVMEYLARNSILSTGQPFTITLYMEDDYLTIETDLNDRLVSHGPSEKAFERLQRSYSLYTDTPLVKVKAYQQNYIKLPVVRIGQETAIT